ncbi:chaperone modulator CbpM [Yeosuana sp. MJ-SS3]|uniref:Chaperone modulator CbpM n=1 Tax=Gilvirhabdus luticola TaxID=3079858 RepID=A0ABU3U5K9_9FLAO|nr:chaperone modulator CbpM [Yeosuana sp. MJ-SS3]MDU8885685.1 chaperone modulator CbpM [Yeosuana sp. MJ-SS3]
MKPTDLIPIELVCKHYKIPVAFINALQEFQLIELTIEKDTFFMHKKQLNKFEKIARLHYDLDINLEGIDAIYNLLDQLDNLKEEITMLHNKLRLYEDL